MGWNLPDGCSDRDIDEALGVDRLVECEACGVFFLPEEGYYEVDNPDEGIIGYSYCFECCHW